MGKICAFFGHRDEYPDIVKLKEQIKYVIEKENVSKFWCGGYGVFDNCAASLVKQIRKEFNQIELQLILAYLPKDNEKISGIYDSSIYPESLELCHPRFAISKRNQWIIKRCDVVICYINHSYGGAYSAYKIAKKSGKIIYNIGSLVE